MNHQYRFRCNCGRRLILTDSLVGKTGKCSCGAKIQVTRELLNGLELSGSTSPQPSEGGTQDSEVRVTSMDELREAVKIGHARIVAVGDKLRSELPGSMPVVLLVEISQNYTIAKEADGAIVFTASRPSQRKG